MVRFGSLALSNTALFRAYAVRRCGLPDTPCNYPTWRGPITIPAPVCFLHFAFPRYGCIVLRILRSPFPHLTCGCNRFALRYLVSTYTARTPGSLHGTRCLPSTTPPRPASWSYSCSLLFVLVSRTPHERWFRGWVCTPFVLQDALLTRYHFRPHPTLPDAIWLPFTTLLRAHLRPDGLLPLCRFLHRVCTYTPAPAWPDAFCRYGLATVLTPTTGCGLRTADLLHSFAFHYTSTHRSALHYHAAGGSLRVLRFQFHCSLTFFVSICLHCDLPHWYVARI